MTHRDDSTEEPTASRRQVLGLMSAPFVADLFGFDLDMPTLGGSPDEFWVLATEEVGAYVDVTPERAPALVVEPDGSIYSWSINDGSWVQLDGGGGSAAVLEDAGSDTTDGGDLYQFPGAEDSLDLQGTGEIQSAAKLTTQKADITGETYIRGSLQTDINSVSSGTFKNIIDTEVKDSEDELDSSYQFSPSETAEYEVLAQTQITPGGDQDRVQLRVRNVTDGTVTFFKDEQASGTGKQSVGLHASTELNSAKNYEVQVGDLDSTYDILSNSGTFATIKRSVVHP